MERKCDRCKKKIPADAFICHHCGRILGDPVSYAARAKKPAKTKTRSHPKRWLLAALALVLLAGLGMLIWHMGQMEDPSVPTTVPPVTTVGPIETTAPLTSYTVSVEAEDPTLLRGVYAHIYLAGEKLYSGMLDESGSVIFILPTREDYTVRLTGLPALFESYADSIFGFEAGAQTLLISLETALVPYTVKVVNSQGEPVSGTCIAFYPASDPEQTQITDETGCCVFYAEYEEGLSSACIRFAPSGYYLDDIPSVSFQSGSLEAKFVLYTYEEKGFTADQVYTVRIVDKNGEPVPDLYVNVNQLGSNDIEWIITSGITNLDGCYSFAGDPADNYRIRIFEKVLNQYAFDFGKGSRELLIRIGATEPVAYYSYTVLFQNQFGEPVPDVLIGLDTPEMEAFRSDANGAITFMSEEADASKVSFHIYSMPDGFDLGSYSDTAFTFSAGSRMMDVYLLYEDTVEYTIKIVDLAGNPIAGAAVEVTKSNPYWSVKEETDAQGLCTFSLKATDSYMVTVVWLPEAYKYLSYSYYQITTYSKTMCIWPDGARIDTKEG